MSSSPLMTVAVGLRVTVEDLWRLGPEQWMCPKGCLTWQDSERRNYNFCSFCGRPIERRRQEQHSRLHKTILEALGALDGEEDHEFDYEATPGLGIHSLGLEWRESGRTHAPAGYVVGYKLGVVSDSRRAGSWREATMDNPDEVFAEARAFCDKVGLKGEINLYAAVWL